MDLGLHGKIGLVTGGSAGIGKATAKALAGEGVDVAIAARDPERLESAAAEIRDATGRRVLAIPTDLSRLGEAEDCVDRVVAEFGRIDILVNNAGAARFGDPLTLDPEAFAEAMQLKYLGYVHCTRAAAPHMIKQGWGRIVNVAGEAGKQIHVRDGFIPGALAGGPTNAAIMLFTKGFALRVASHGVLVNAVSPGAVATERLVRAIRTVAQREEVGYDEAEREFFKDSPLGRAARPEEIADVILFLASERATYFVGATLHVDGGTVTAV